MNSKDIQGIPIIKRADGKRVGVIDQLYLDPAATRLVGVSIRREAGLLGGRATEATTIAMASVHALLPDALTVNDVPRADAAWSTDDGAFVPLSDIVGRQVRTEGGITGGEVAAFSVDERTFAVTEVWVAHGLLKSSTTRIPRDLLVRIAPEAVVVKDGAIASD